MKFKEQVVLEINPRTKEKIVKPLIECELDENYTVNDLIKEHKKTIKEVESLKKINLKLINAVASLTKSTQVQIADIKEEIK